MPQNRPAIPEAMKRQVLFEARHHCAVCGNPLPVEQAHIIPWSKSRHHSVENLIALCANCHSRADKEHWGAKTLRMYKKHPCILARTSNAPQLRDAHLPGVQVGADNAGSGFTSLHQLKPPVSDFTGRDTQLIELRRKVSQGSVAITGVRGMGGAGKTELARRLAAELKPDYPDAQLEIDLKGVSPQPLSQAEVLSGILRAFFPTEKLPETTAELAALLRSHLAEKHVLLLLDNAKDGQQIAPLVPPPQGWRVLVTSRQHFALPGLEAVNLGPMEPLEARKLLLRIAPRIGAEAGALAELCGRLPLALRLAASLLANRPDLAPADYVGQLKKARERLRHLASGRAFTAEDLDLEASFDLSFQQLKPEHQGLFAQLAVFPSHFDAAAAMAVWALEESATQEALGELMRFSLLDWQAGYVLHDLLREFAAKHLDPTMGEAVRRRHARHFKDLAVLWSQHRTPKKLFESIWFFGHERVNIEAAFAYLQAAPGSAKELVELVSFVIPSNSISTNSANIIGLEPRECSRWFTAQLQAALEIGDREGEARALGNLGDAHTVLGEVRQAIGFYEQRLEIAREVGDRGSQAIMLDSLGTAHSSLGEVCQAIGFYEQCLEIAREVSDRQRETKMLGHLGDAYRSVGEVRRAIGYYEQFVEVFRESGDRERESRVLNDLGNLYHSLGEVRQAIVFSEQALKITREIGDREGEGIALFNSAVSLRDIGQQPEAIAAGEAALRIFEQIEPPKANIVRRYLAEWRKS